MRKFIFILIILAVTGIANLYAAKNNLFVPGSGTGCGVPPGHVWNGSSSSDWNTASNWTPSGVPDSADIVSIPATATNNPVISSNGMRCSNLTLDSAAILTIQAGYDLSVYGDLTLSKGAGMVNRGTTYLWNNLNNNNITPTFMDTGVFSFCGSADQNINGPCIFGKLAINNGNDINLNTGVQVTKMLTLSSGLLNLGNSDLTLGSLAVISGTPSASAMVVATGTGQIKKEFSSPGSFTFPVGDNDGIAEYSPVMLNFISGSFSSGAYAAVNLVNSKYPDANITDNYLKRYWIVSQNGISSFSCNASFNYSNGDIVGQDSSILCSRYVPVPVTDFSKADTTLNRLTANGLTFFGTFTGTMDNYKKLNLTVLLEGLYAGSGTMNPAWDAGGPHWGSGIADKITVELHDTVTYSTIIYSVSDVSLDVNGLATVTIPVTLKSRYYITVKHRNSIETVTANPVGLPGRYAVSYNFTTSAGKAYGNNQKGVVGIYMIYSGDITSAGIYYPASPVRDGITDLEDLYYIFASYLNGDMGYLPSDLNGDGVVDITDEYMAFDNFLLGIYAITP